jgi:hypothetical protein
LLYFIDLLQDKKIPSLAEPFVKSFDAKIRFKEKPLNI